MKKTKIAILAVIVATGATLMRCSGDPGSNVSTGYFIIPADLPTNIVPGFNFPENPDVINSWIADTVFNDAAIYAHAWGIWAGLTANSGQVYAGDTLLVFETWPGIKEIQKFMNPANLFTSDKLDSAKTTRNFLEVPSQVIHHRMANFNQDSTFSDTNNIFDAVTYNLPAAIFAVENAILKQESLQSKMVPGGIGAIPVFPSDAITLKPTYFVAKPVGNLIRIPVWPGEPSEMKPFAPVVWGSYVYADTTNSQQPGKALQPVTSANPTTAEIAAATCNVNDFIHFTMDSLVAAAFDSTQAGGNFTEGDLAILIAMHVATKETANWTWQSFYWDPQPNNPMFPGSNLSKPTQIKGAPAHYSATTAYAMLAPNQPVTGGSNNPKLRAVIGYNPYLEADFNAATFQTPNAYNASFKYGMQTNCMSCHALAIYAPNNAFNYSTDQYIDMGDTALFNNTVQLDFAWSIAVNMIKTNSSKK